jgi:hypothetical protein
MMKIEKVDVRTLVYVLYLSKVYPKGLEVLHSLSEVEATNAVEENTLRIGRFLIGLGAALMLNTLTQSAISASGKPAMLEWLEGLPLDYQAFTRGLIALEREKGQP